MSDALLTVLVVAIAGLAGPLLLSWLTNRNRRQEKIEDYARQDAVAAEVKAAAAQATEAAKLLVESNAEVAGAAKAVAAKTTERFDSLDTGQKDIHALVDGDKTARMQAQLVSLEAQLSLMREVMSLKRDVGKEPTIEAVADLDVMKSRIAELSAELRERLKLLSPRAAESA